MDSWFFLSCPAEVILIVAGREEAKNPAGSPPTDSDPLAASSLEKMLCAGQAQSRRLPTPSVLETRAPTPMAVFQSPRPFAVMPLKKSGLLPMEVLSLA